MPLGQNVLIKDDITTLPNLEEMLGKLVSSVLITLIKRALSFWLISFEGFLF